MSSRAACRFEQCGARDVSILTGGRASWTTMGLPTEGQSGDRRRVAAALRPAAAVAIDARVADAAALPSRHMVAVLGCERVLVGAVPVDTRDWPPETPVDRVMVPAPATIRPDLRTGEVASRLRKDHLDSIFVTTAYGVLLGVVYADDLGA